MKQSGVNKLMKRSFFILLLLTLTFSAGCGAKEETPKGEASSDGLTSFQTKDIYGEDKDQSIFKDYKLTMVNVWGTFCSPCLEEMPYLGEIQKEYEPKGVNIVGIVVDVQDQKMNVIEDQIDLAKEIVDGTGADYTHLLVTEEMVNSVLNQFDAIPATFFVDSDGNIVSEFYIGSREKKDWVDIIETNIKKQES